MMFLFKRYTLRDQLSGSGDPGGSGSAQTAPQADTQTPGTPEPTAPVDPMDQFNELFAKKSTEQATQTTPTAPADPWAVDAKRLQDSSRVIGDALAANTDPAAIQAALSGDVASFNNLLANASKVAYMAAVQQTASIVQAAVKQQLSDYDGQLLGKFTSWQANNDVSTDPRLKNPAVKGIVDMAMPLIRQQNPNATPQELAAKSRAFLDALAPTLGGQQQQETPQRQTEQQPTDWAAVLGIK